MVSKARLDLPLPLGPVMTVNSPRGRSRSIPLRLFWRAPRISTQPVSVGAVTQGFSAIFEPTEDYPITGTGSQIFGRVCSGAALSANDTRIWSNAGSGRDSAVATRTALDVLQAEPFRYF